MKIHRVFAALSFAALVVATVPAGATQLTVSSYSMFNGAHGSFNYRDFDYVPCNNVCDVTGAALNFGTGKLTDGVSPTSSWYQQGELTQWVGWDNTQLNGADPTVTFNFASTVTVNSVNILGGQHDRGRRCLPAERRLHQWHVLCHRSRQREPRSARLHVFRFEHYGHQRGCPVLSDYWFRHSLDHGR